MSTRQASTTDGQGAKETDTACLGICLQPVQFVLDTSDSEALCEDGSEFREAYGACISCAKESAAEAGIAVTSIIPSLAPVVAHCSGSAITSTLTISKTDGGLTTIKFPVIVPTSSVTGDVDGDGEGPPAGVTGGPRGPWATAGGRPPWLSWSGTPFWGNGFPPWVTASVPWTGGPPPWLTLASMTEAPGCPATTVPMLPDTASYMSQWCTGPWPTATADAQITPAPSTLSTSTLPSTSTPATGDFGSGSDSSSNSNSDSAWIAGPVIGSIFGLAVVLGALFFWRRRRHSQAAGKASSELDAEKPPAELHQEVAYEMEGSSPIDLYAEKPANEFPAKELGG